MIKGEGRHGQRAGVLGFGEIGEHGKRTLQRSNGSMVTGEREDRPRQTPRRSQSCGNTFQVVDPRLNDIVVGLIAKREESDRRVVSVRSNGLSIDDTVARVPSSSGASTIQKHLNPAGDPWRNLFQSTASARELF